MQRSDWPPPPATHAGAQPVTDALAEFRPERCVPIRPPIGRPAPRPPDIRPARRASVASAVASAVRATGEQRESLWSFAVGSVFGALLCLIVVYWLVASELPRPAPASRALLERPPVGEPSIVVADEHRDPPVIKTASPTPPKPMSRDVGRVTVPPPREEGTNGPFVGSLQIDSTPQGARVFIDRRPVGVTPLVLTGLVVGSHAVRLEADGHTPWSSAIRVTANRKTNVITILAPSLDNGSPSP